MGGNALNRHAPYIEPYQVPDPLEQFDEDDSALGMSLGHADVLSEYTPSFRASLEYKQMRAAARERGKLGF